MLYCSTEVEDGFVLSARFTCVVESVFVTESVMVDLVSFSIICWCLRSIMLDCS